MDSSADFDPQPRHIADMNRRGAYFTLSPQKMVNRIPMLQVAQAAYCLNVAERTIYEWVASGKLASTNDKPVRINAEDVALLMNDFDE